MSKLAEIREYVYLWVETSKLFFELRAQNLFFDVIAPDLVLFPTQQEPVFPATLEGQTILHCIPLTALRSLNLFFPLVKFTDKLQTSMRLCSALIHC